MKYKQFGYYQTLVLIFIGASAIGFMIYPSILSLYENNYSYNYKTDMQESFDEESLIAIRNFTLPANHKYHLKFSVYGRGEARCVFDIDYQFHPDAKLDLNSDANSSWTRGAQWNSEYVEPITVEAEEHVSITINIYPKIDPETGDDDFTLTSWDLDLYQDMPQIALISYIWVLPLVIVSIGLWLKAYEVYEAPFKEAAEKKALEEEVQKEKENIENSEEEVDFVPVERFDK